MALEVGVARGALATAVSGTVDLTTTNLNSTTPKAAIVLATKATANDTQTANALLCVGFTDGTNDNTMGFEAEDADIAITNGRNVNTSAVILDPDTGGGSEDGFASASFINNGVRLTTDNNFPDALLVSAMMFGGDDVVNVTVGTFTLNGVNAVVVTPGHATTLLFLSNNGAAGDAQGGNFGFGMTHNGAGITQKSFDALFRGTDPEQVAAYLSSTAGCSEVNFNATLRHTGSLGSFTSTQFTYTPSADAATDVIHYMAIELSAGVTVDIFDFDSPTATGNDSQTSSSVTPQAGLILETNIGTRDSIVTSSLLGLGVTIFDGTDEFSNSASVEDGVGTSVAKSRSTSAALQCLDTDGTIDADATFVSFNADGWTWNYTTAPPSARRYIGFSIGAATSIQIANVSYLPPSGWAYVAYDGSLIQSDSILYHDDLTATGGSTTTATTSQSYSLDQWNDFILRNETTGAVGTITGVTAGPNSTITCSGGFSGGSRNDVQNGDLCAIVVDISVNDQIGYERTTDNSGSVTIDAKGVPTIIGMAGTHNYDYYIIDETDSQHTADLTATSIVD